MFWLDRPKANEFHCDSIVENEPEMALPGTGPAAVAAVSSRKISAKSGCTCRPGATFSHPATSGRAAGCLCVGRCPAHFSLASVLDGFSSLACAATHVDYHLFRRTYAKVSRQSPTRRQRVRLFRWCLHHDRSVSWLRAVTMPHSMA